ncbi:oxidoreductase [Gordoniibacillus kamchatkensis]|uniref:Oxidoreductase n=1 Tax=Gordoniibacillus kamchatkensis TaxID=1590651 RepID=A0ABR5AHZ3_9BACL|nr:Gfo/Idh/MocA family oxidoreductase [Paenibacillus sp. VKM B-2647]KIL40463.1 oxidoreductase [Paenibacillus sp. VKM B-2647]
MPDLDYRIKLPRDLSMGIGIVGAGEIVRSCHLPAYRMAGFRVVGIYDADPAKARQAAELFGIPYVFESLDALLRHSEIRIVDIAVPAKYQLDIVEQVAAAGKHMLCQKPLAEQYAAAKRITYICAQTGVKAAVNQQMRWSPGISASRGLVKLGLLGQPVQASIQVNVLTQWENWPWLTTIDTLEVMYHSIHYMDSIRYVMGMTPEFIYADGAKFPNQPYKGETRTMIFMKFPGDARGLIHDSHNNRQPQEDWYATFRFEGTEGVARGTNGALYDYPNGRGDTISFYTRKLQPDRLYSPTLEGRWFPHAFMGTMGELMRAVEDEREPENSVADNLLTLQMVFASYRSMAENRPVYLSEIAGE